MPTYQYSCTECGHFFEQFQSFSDSSLTDCPVCEGRLRKVFNAVGVVFKGSGFYRNDSRSEGSSGGGTAAAEVGKPATGSSSTDAGSTGSGSGKDSGTDSGKNSGKSAGGKDSAKTPSTSSTGAGSGSGSASTSGSAA